MSIFSKTSDGSVRTKVKVFTTLSKALHHLAFIITHSLKSLVTFLPQDISWAGLSPWNDIISDIPMTNCFIFFYFFYSNATFTIKLTIIILFKIEILPHLALPIRFNQLYIFLFHSIFLYLISIYLLAMVNYIFLFGRI